ncbi:MAG: hypothetical protein JNL10_12910 [Verrucomicrobiales bacterium]|nr:hypothetical protein [Verrucomicrobiales bacterium]
MRRSRRVAWVHAVWVAVAMVAALPAHALIFSSTGDTNYNTTPPTGALAGSGWQWQGQFRIATGTPIAPEYFITAGHLGGQVGETFLFNGVTYTTIARYMSPNSDLTLWKVNGTFPTYAPIYVRKDEVGKNAVLFGRGVTRGTAVNVANLGEDALRGWRWNPNYTGGTLRWGENTIQDARNFPANDPYPANGDLLVMDFDRFDGTNPNEVTLGSLDSGGGLFLLDAVDNQWKLAGVNVDAEYAFSFDANGTVFVASIFDMGGLYYDEEGDTVGPVGTDPLIYAPNTGTDFPSRLYSVRLSSNIEWIRSVTGVPPVNTAPTFASVSNQTAQEFVPSQWTLTASDSDQPAQALAFKLESGPGGLTVTSGGVVQWTPDESQGGFSFLVSVSVGDNGYPPLGVTNQFWIEVQEVNQSPVIGSISPPAATETQPLTFPLNGSDPDFPANHLVFSLTEGPPGLTVAADGTVEWTPNEAQGGVSHTVKVALTDDGVPPLSATAQFDIPVADVNSAPVLNAVGGLVADELIPFALQLSASDPDIPANGVSFDLVDGPPGLTVSSSGLLQWTPGEAAGGTTYPVAIRVFDDATPPMSSTAVISIQVADAPALNRTMWQIGTDSPTGTPINTQMAEFSLQNNLNDLRPGKVTRLPEDPAYAGAGANPGADDDFYFSGNYPAGFNGLTAVLRVPFDEPPIAWERAHTLGDKTNRVHFLLGSAQTGVDTTFRLTIDLPSGGSSSGSTVISGFADHDYVVRFRNGAGLTTLLYSNRISRATILMIDFTAAQVAATLGGNSVELIRTGPAVAGISYWLTYDHVRLEVLNPNLPPQIAAVGNLAADEGIPLSYTLSASDPDGPSSGLTFSLVSGPPGLVVSPAGVVSWTPKETQGGASHPVVVAVTDSAVSPKSATTQFSIQVADVPQLDRTVWQLGVDSPPGSSNGTLWGEFSLQNNKNDARPGLVTRLPGDPVYDSNPAANPGADDDFYFGGVFPPGFNSLPSILRVPNDEPFSAWERAHTLGDRTNRVHFVLGSPLVAGAAKFRLTVDLPSASWSVGGVTQPGYGDHDFTVAFVNGTGVRTVLYSDRISQSTNLVLNFTAAQVAATFGANSLELTRVGPAVASTSYWIAYDHLRFESVP